LDLNLNPEDELFKITTLTTNLDPPIPGFLNPIVQAWLANLWVSRDGQESSNERLLNVRKAELVSNLGNCLAQLIRKLNIFIISELLLPEMAVCDTLFKIGIRK
jgi:hypothetical protein